MSIKKSKSRTELLEINAEHSGVNSVANSREKWTLAIFNIKSKNFRNIIKCIILKLSPYYRQIDNINKKIVEYAKTIDNQKLLITKLSHDIKRFETIHRDQREKILSIEKYNSSIYNKLIEMECVDQENNSSNKKAMEILAKKTDGNRMVFENNFNILKKDTNTIFAYLTKGLILRSPGSTEREIVISPYEVKQNHLLRYKYAIKYISKGAKVLDIACGAGYGCSLIRKESCVDEMFGVDLSKQSIEFANRVYQSENIKFINGNCVNRTLFGSDCFDVIVSFETIEHVKEYGKFIENCFFWLKKGGVLIGSVPNENVLPFDKETHLFHVKHFSKDEIKALLLKCGFKIEYLEYGDWNEVPVEHPAYTHIFRAIKP